MSTRCCFLFFSSRRKIFSFIFTGNITLEEQEEKITRRERKEEQAEELEKRNGNYLLFNVIVLISHAYFINIFDRYMYMRNMIRR